MIEERLKAVISHNPDQPFLTSSAGNISYRDFLAQCIQFRANLGRYAGKRFACFMADSEQLISIMLAMGMSDRSLLMINRDFSEEQITELLARYAIDLLICDTELPTRLPCPIIHSSALSAEPSSEPGPVSRAGEVLVLTSGTTGQPKCARYTWNDLFAQVRQTDTRACERWLLAYRLNHFAGLQMLVHVIATGGTLVIPDSSKVSDALQAIAAFEVTHVSSTPTFWRYALASLPVSGKALSLQHITLGSEAVSAALLDTLHETFPDARIVHVYASTEAGSCISVNDLRPGLPIDILSRDKDSPVQFQVRDDELYVRSQHGMKAYADAGETANRDEWGWLATGDLVEVQGDRIVFLGRRSETINVGGVKVHPLEVENTISALPEVKLARVYGQQNPVTGQIVAVDLVQAEGFSPAAVESSVRSACTALGRHARPRMINIVDSIETNNYKLKRSTPAS
ncbi:MAG: acyl--CoA ligase [Halioglobus sp.]|nr:acyl--CoA ligase [Halioglobus sp.]